MDLFRDVGRALPRVRVKARDSWGAIILHSHLYADHLEIPHGVRDAVRERSREIPGHGVLGTCREVNNLLADP